ncbi:hypothetical protein SISNIDRAFT_59898 [Sistotremastrum niveocremeum HHB9708]|uniref:Uncharacterized protein n=1 Tax=Sistotremastrum niveocremeum HHB9708 TaxID=1314777 RepID=A0A164VFG5_9AGAM|nr:hypothetical protein SISNIDRAFT_59898 [Sistotremastrum niveocremeum HHB9708]
MSKLLELGNLFPGSLFGEPVGGPESHSIRSKCRLKPPTFPTELRWHGWSLPARLHASHFRR